MSVTLLMYGGKAIYGDGMVTDRSSDLLAGDHSSSTHVSGYVVDGGFVMAANAVIIIIKL